MYPLTRISRHLTALAAILVLAACAQEDLTKPPKPLGDFDLGYAVVVARDAKQVGPSRPASPEEWEAALKKEIELRTGRYDGDKLYHLGINVDGYALAVPGIPTVFSPKSVLVISVNVWDDTAQRKINAVPKQMNIFEKGGPKMMIGSGITQNRLQQMQNLSAQAARAINKWLVENKAWFTPEAVAARASSTAPKEAFLIPQPAN